MESVRSGTMILKRTGRFKTDRNEFIDLDFQRWQQAHLFKQLFDDGIHDKQYHHSKSKTFRWCDKADDSFKLLKKKLTEAPILALPDFTKPFPSWMWRISRGNRRSVISREETHCFFQWKVKWSKEEVLNLWYRALCRQALRFWRHYLIHAEFILRTFLIG